MTSEPDHDKVMFDFDSFEDYQGFSEKVDRLYGEGSFEEVGKHTNNVVIFLPGNEEDYRLAVEGNYDPLFDSKHQTIRENESFEEIVEAVGQPPEGTTAKTGTGFTGKGASGLPQQFVELLMYSGGIYGGLRAFYDVGKYTIKAMAYLYDKHSWSPVLNKGGVIGICAVDLLENRSVEEFYFVSAIEAQEGHRWDPTVDGRDLYYVTFVGANGQGHLYVANALGAILHYAEYPLTESWEIKPTLTNENED
jgi:hypothetical protein